MGSTAKRIEYCSESALSSAVTFGRPRGVLVDIDQPMEWALPKRAGHFDFAYSWRSHVPLDGDISVFLLAGGRARSEDDFIFYGRPPAAHQPVDYPGKVTGRDGAVTDAVTIHLTRLDAAVDSVLFAMTVDGPIGSTLADLGPITGSFATAAGPVVIETHAARGTTTIGAFEIVRQGAHWLTRVADRAYPDGLAALARDCGIDIAAEGEALPAVPVAGVPPGPAIDWTRPPVPAGYELDGS